MSTEARIVLTTASSQEEAERIARHLVEAGLAACVNVLPGATSIYRWQGVIESSTESLLIIKTTTDHVSALQASLLQIHSYELPECLVVAVESGSPGYLAWLASPLE
jgi:periplasmic divalent cation tolerance protein